MGRLGKIQLSPVQVLEFIVLGIKNGKHEDAIAIAEDCIAQLKEYNLVFKKQEEEKEGL